MQILGGPENAGCGALGLELTKGQDGGAGGGSELKAKALRGPRRKRMPSVECVPLGRHWAPSLMTTMSCILSTPPRR